MLAELTQEEYSAALDATVAELFSAIGDPRPPIDALSVAGALGFAVAIDDEQRGRARFVRLTGCNDGPPRGSILLRTDPRPERLHWAVAHEIGEQLARRVFARLAVDPREAPSNAREQVANQLAGRILLPAEAFERDAAVSNWDLLALKKQYDTASHELIARRMLDFSPRVIVTIFDQGQITFRRANWSNRTPSVSAAEATCQRTVHATNRQHVEFADQSTICGWPIHEPEWKREILRTVGPSDEIIGEGY